MHNDHFTHSTLYEDFLHIFCTFFVCVPPSYQILCSVTVTIFAQHPAKISPSCFVVTFSVYFLPSHIVKGTNYIFCMHFLCRVNFLYLLDINPSLKISIFTFVNAYKSTVKDLLMRCLSDLIMGVHRKKYQKYIFLAGDGHNFY